MAKKKSGILLLLLTTLFFILSSLFSLQAVESKMVLTHLTTDDGLSQNTVVTVHKDKKGLMWFGTWDGLNKYDGYRFTVYKSNIDPADENSPIHTRVDKIQEDRYGYLWVKTYDELLYRFDPSKEYFLRISTSEKSDEKSLDKVDKTWVLDNGIVWVSLQKGGSIMLKTDSVSGKLEINDVFKHKSLKNTGKINLISLDAEKTTWFLTANGLLRQLKNELLPKKVGKSDSYTSFLETANTIYFGANSGIIMSYDKITKTFSQINTPFSTTVRFLEELPGNRLFAGSVNSGFIIIDNKTGKFDLYNKTLFPSMKSNNINGVHSDRFGDIWLSLDIPGVMRFIPEKKEFSYLWLNTPNDKRSLTQDSRFFVFEDKFGNFWIHTLEGTLFTLDRKSNKLRWFYNKPGDPNCVFKTNIQVAWADPEGVLWICSGNQGIYKCVQRRRDFLFTSMEPYVSSGSPDIRSLFEDKAGNYWVSSKSGVVRVLDKGFKSKGVLCSDGKLRPVSDINLIVYEMHLDKKGRIWLATKGQGLVILTPENKDYTSFKIVFYKSNKADKYSLPDNKLYDIYEDKNGRIWLGSYDGGLILAEETADKIKFIHHLNDFSQYPIESCSRVRCIEGDKSGNIWVGSTNGYLVFSTRFKEYKNVKFYHYNRDFRGNELPGSDIYDIMCDTKGRVWLGTFGGGLLKFNHFTLGKDPEYEIYNQKNGFHTDIVLALAEDSKNKIWITSENTLARFDPENLNRELYNVSNGLESGDFLESSVFITSKGEMMFGNASGFYTFNPLKIEKNTFSPNIVFTRLQLFGRDVQVGKKGSPLEKHINDLEVVKLNHKQRTFNIEFAALDFQNPENIQYEYKLDGFEDEWNIASKQRVATYTGLPRGKYTLMVKSTNSDGVWSDNLTKLKIEVLPSFWETIWAFFIYLILAVLIIAGGIYLLLFYFKLKNEVVIEQKLTDLKLRFFTDISHELRTPLTLITAPVEHILKQEEVSDSVKSQLQIVQKNTERMIRLINEILDFRKVQNKNKRLKLQEVVFADVVRKSCLNFDEIAKEQNIDFDLKDNSKNVLVWLDINALDTILFNLLSNAFKFTPSERKITVTLEASNEEAIIKVSDQGIGIDKALQSKIFERFYSVDLSDDAAKRSSGIGLSLVKELVNLHGATIEVFSNPGEGTTFVIHFKLGAAHFGKDVDFILEDGVGGSLSVADDVEADCHEQDVNHKEYSQMVLIVEDNEDLRPFLKTVLSKKYRVAVAADGKTAWEMVQSLLPDFIITDLMIPGISGTDLIKLIRNDDRTCHIPLVVLSAKTNMETKLECLDLGADDYITKPFSATFLEARVSNMMHQRSRLQSYYRDVLMLSDNKFEVDVPMPQAHSRDDEFMNRLMSVMETNISNGSFTVEQLCSLAGFGRTVFFNKLKSLTGLSPNEYIREVRLKRAAQLLEIGDYTVSQITYMVGMNDSRYFSKCFKQKYNMTPTEYRDSTKNM